MPDHAFTARTVPDRHHTSGHASQCAGRDRDSTRAAHGRRAAVQQPDGAVSLSGLRAAGGRAPEVSGVGAGCSLGPAGGSSGLVVVSPPSRRAGPLHRLEQARAAEEPSSDCLQHAVSDPAVGESAAPGVAHFGADGGPHLGGLGSPVCASVLSAGDLRGSGAIPGNLLSGGELESAGGDDGTRQSRSHPPAEPVHQAGAGVALASAVPGTVERVYPMKRPRIDVNLTELDEVLDQARQAPLSEADYNKLKTLLHTLVKLLVAPRRTEKTRAVVGDAGGDAVAGEAAASGEKKKTNGHGRTPASAYTGATKVDVPHPNLKPGDACPECPKGKVYVNQEPRPLVRVVGQAPLGATVYALEQLRCNACGQLFTAPAPEGVGAEKYDATAIAMIAELKYGSGVPFYRIENLEDRLGVPKLYRVGCGFPNFFGFCIPACVE